MRTDWRKAALEGDGITVQRLLVEGVDINALDKYGQTALMLAALHGRFEVAQVLVEAGANLDVTAKYGLSALMLAIINHHADIAHVLVDAGANTQLCGTESSGFFDKAALDLAEGNGMVDVADYIRRLQGN
ncbi:MAG: ankyrin repeat domain-containing protein [Proteobacteria bacterium]|nr:ankyrin repeat domain-containing protein [Pseudomonadota bacterium]